MENKVQYREQQEQAWLINWFRMQYPDKLLYAIPNGGYRNMREAANLKRQGVVAGIPDLCLAYANDGYHGLYIELKRTPSPGKKGILSASQAKMLRHLDAQGYKAVVAHGWNEAKDILTDYIDA